MFTDSYMNQWPPIISKANITLQLMHRYIQYMLLLKTTSNIFQFKEFKKNLS